MDLLIRSSQLAKLYCDAVQRSVLFSRPRYISFIEVRLCRIKFVRERIVSE